MFTRVRASPFSITTASSHVVHVQRSSPSSARSAVTINAFSPDGTRVVTASWDRTARVWDVSGIPPGNILQVACTYLKMHEDPVSLEGVTQYPLTFDRPICVTDPPPPDLAGETVPTESRP
jgi:WD40 repeat protein